MTVRLRSCADTIASANLGQDGRLSLLWEGNRAVLVDWTFSSHKYGRAEVRQCTEPNNVVSCCVGTLAHWRSLAESLACSCLIAELEFAQLLLYRAAPAAAAAAL